MYLGSGLPCSFISLLVYIQQEPEFLSQLPSRADCFLGWGFLNPTTALASDSPVLIVSSILCDFYYNIYLHYYLHYRFIDFRRVGKNREIRLLSLSCLSLSLCPSAWNNWAPIGQIFMKFDIAVFFENLL